MSLRRIRNLAAALALTLGLGGIAQAGQVHVSPVRLEIAAPGAVTALTLQNQGRAPVTIQTRVFAWTQKNGVDQLVPARGVVASPPMTKLAPGAKTVVRVVRTAKGRVRGEETYRVMVDEIPPANNKPNSVAMVVRQSIPLFVASGNAKDARPAFAIARTGRGGELVVTNRGERSLRLADLSAVVGGRAALMAPGLVGYVHGKSTMRFPLSAAAMRMVNGRSAQLITSTQDGPLHVQAKVR